MKKNKKFDCVQMKWDIQQKLNQEYKGVSDEEFNKIMRKKITQNPILNSFLKNIPVKTQNNITA